MCEPQIENYIHMNDYYEALDQYYFQEEEVKPWLHELRKEIQAFEKRQWNKVEDPDDKIIIDRIYLSKEDERPIATQNDIDRIRSLFNKSKTHGLSFYRKVLDELHYYQTPIEVRENNPWIDSIYVKWNELEYEDTKKKKKDQIQEEARKQRALETRNNKKYKCYECNLFTNNRKIWEEHIGSKDHFIKTNDQEGLAKLKCEACGKDDFENLLEVDKHKKTLHCDALRTCPHCKKLFTRKQTFLEHNQSTCSSKINAEKQKDLEQLEALKKKLGL